MSQWVVHCRRSPYDVYIGRPGFWGNNFQIGVYGDRERCIGAYREMLLADPRMIEKAKTELRGKVLGCWCAPQRCHGDVLAEVANEETGGGIPSQEECP